MVPAAAPQVISGLQIALPLSLIIGIVTEMLTGGDGLGSYMIRGVRFSDSETAFAGLLAMLVTGLAYMQTRGSAAAAPVAMARRNGGRVSVTDGRRVYLRRHLRGV